MSIDLQDYVEVDERISLFYAAHPSGRIITRLVDATGEVGKTRWTVEAQVFRDDERERPDATGLAFEVDGAGMTQRAAALETCETSAIGRALANLGFTGNRRRATRTEMRKALIAGLKDHIEAATTKDALKELWGRASQQDVLDAVREDLKKANERLGGGSDGAA